MAYMGYGYDNMDQVVADGDATRIQGGDVTTVNGKAVSNNDNGNSNGNKRHTDGNQLVPAKISYNKTTSEIIVEEVTQEVFDRVTNGGTENVFPNFKTLMSNYPKPYKSKPNRIPANPKIPVSNDNGASFKYPNQCAIRLSITLRLSGVDISGVKNISNPGGQTFTEDGDVIGAKNLALGLRKILGAPQRLDGSVIGYEGIMKSIAGKTGIIYFENFLEQDSKTHTYRRESNAAHIDLFNIVTIMGGFPEWQMFGAKKIWFWEIK